MLTKPEIDLPIRAGITSLYVSVVESSTLIALAPASTEETKFGKSRYESGPATKSTPKLFINSSFIRSAMQPITPTTRCLFFLRREAKYWSLPITFCSALSRIEQVFTIMASASVILSQSTYPTVSITEATTSLSATFI